MGLLNGRLEVGTILVVKISFSFCFLISIGFLCFPNKITSLLELESEGLSTFSTNIVVHNYVKIIYTHISEIK